MERESSSIETSGRESEPLSDGGFQRIAADLQTGSEGVARGLSSGRSAGDTVHPALAGINVADAYRRLTSVSVTPGFESDQAFTKNPSEKPKDLEIQKPADYRIEPEEEEKEDLEGPKVQDSNRESPKLSPDSERDLNKLHETYSKFPLGEKPNPQDQDSYDRGLKDTLKDLEKLADDLSSQPGSTEASVEKGLKEAVARIGKNPDGSPKADIVSTKDEEGRVSYHLVLANDHDEHKDNIQAIKDGKDELGTGHIRSFYPFEALPPQRV